MKQRLLYIILFCWAVAMQSFAQADRQFIREGNRLFRQQNYVKAETAYRKALSKNSRNTQAMYNLGCALMMQKKDSLGIKWLEQAAQEEKIPMRRAKAYHNMGVICQGHQLFAEAIEAYKSSLRINPNDDETRYNLVLCKRQLKNSPTKDNKNKNQKDKDKNKNDKNKQKNQQDKQDNQKDKQDKKQNQPQPKEQMSKENAEQLLNAAMQEEQATKQRLKSKMQRPRSKTLEKNW